MDENKPISVVRPHGRAWRVIGVGLFAAIVASWFVWGPFGIIFYVGGLVNSMWVHEVGLLMIPLCLLALGGLLVVGVDALWRWRQLAGGAKFLRLLMVIACSAFLASFVLGFSGVIPAPFDMYVRGFTGYVESRTDITAIQRWLATLDPNDYTGKTVDPGGVAIGPAELPKAMNRLSPKSARVLPDRKGQLMVRLFWGGGLIGHWGIQVGDVAMEPTPDEYYEYHRLAPGAYFWYEL